MNKLIKLSKGKVAIIDKRDLDKVKRFSWYAAIGNRGKYYARAYIRKEVGKYSSIYMHRLLVGVKTGDKVQVDHRNSNTLDNRRCNLRRASNAQNSMNRKKQAGFTSRFKGVAWEKECCCWRAQIMVNKKAIYLGRFNSEADAARCYNKKAKEIFGEYALLNNI